MKLLESKYYRPRHVMAEYFRENQYRIESQALDQKTLASETPYTELLQSLMPTISLYHENIVIKREDLSDFEQCTDYFPIAINLDSHDFYYQEQCYYHPEYELFIICNERLDGDFAKGLNKAGFASVELIGYDVRNANNLHHIQSFYQRYLQKYVSEDAKVSLLLKDGKDLVFKSHQIKPHQINIQTMYNDDFQEVHQKIKEELSRKNKGVVLLHGLAGSGKTNYIKWLTTQVPNKNFIFVPNNMIEVLARPEFMSILIEQKNSILVLEDCENYIAERIGGGNTSDVVSTILNIADGILSDILECQFICTFNADLMNVDHALLRHGRLIAEYQFHALTVEKSNQYLQSVGKKITVDEPKTLAELTNIDEKLYQAEKEKKPFGFAEH